MTIYLYFDGACEPVNPGGVASAGWVIKDGEGHTLSTGCAFIGEGEGMTNNVAEYKALWNGLQSLQLQATDTLVIRGDSKLIVNQITGAWACNKSHLRELRDECRAILAGLNWRSEWIPREQNEEADAMSRNGYEQHTSKMFPQRARSVK